MSPHSQDNRCLHINLGVLPSTWHFTGACLDRFTGLSAHSCFFLICYSYFLHKLITLISLTISNVFVMLRSISSLVIPHKCPFYLFCFSANVFWRFMAFFTPRIIAAKLLNPECHFINRTDFTVHVHCLFLNHWRLNRRESAWLVGWSHGTISQTCGTTEGACL